jgi:hypothetical protein
MGSLGSRLKIALQRFRVEAHDRDQGVPASLIKVPPLPFGLDTKYAPGANPGRLILAATTPRRDTVRTYSAKAVVRSLLLRSVKFSVSRE